jgi:hypothetical protein
MKLKSKQTEYSNKFNLLRFVDKAKMRRKRKQQDVTGGLSKQNMERKSPNWSLNKVKKESTYRTTQEEEEKVG